MVVKNLTEDTTKIVRGLRQTHEFYFHNDKLTDDNVRSKQALNEELVDKLKRKTGRMDSPPL